MKTNELKTGNVFKDLYGHSMCSRIPADKIKDTLTFLHNITKLPIKNNILGSAFKKKKSSGDLDIAVDNNISKSDLEQLLMKWVEKFHPTDNAKQWIKRTGISVHFKTPISGNESLGYVQTDFMFTSDPNWLKFAMFSPGDSSNYSGADRNKLMASVAKANNLKYSWKNGLIDRNSGKLISKNPDEIAHKLFDDSYDMHVFDKVENMQKAIKDNIDLYKKLEQLINSLNSEISLVTGLHKTPGEIRLNKSEANHLIKLIQ